MEPRPLSEIAKLLTDGGPAGATLASLVRALEESGYARNLFTALDGGDVVLAPPRGPGSTLGALRIGEAAGEVVLRFQRPGDRAPLLRRVHPSDAHRAVVEFLTARGGVPPGFAPDVS